MKKNCFYLLVLGFIISGFFPPNVHAANNDPDALAGVTLEAKKGGYELIDIDALWALYQDQQANLVLVDTRQEWEFSAGYIRNARNFPMEPTWLARMTRRGELEQFLGPDTSQVFVFY